MIETGNWGQVGDANFLLRGINILENFYFLVRHQNIISYSEVYYVLYNL